MQHSLINEASDAARNRWPSILHQLGVEPDVLNGKHQACPMCGGTDRFRFTDMNGEGRYFCSGCGPGDGFDLASKVLGMSLGLTARKVRQVAKGCSDDVFVARPDTEERKASLNRMWQSAKSWQSAKDYLKSRGCIGDVALYQDLRGGRVWHKERGRKYDAMLALVRDKGGRPLTIHRTFLEDRRRFDRKLMPPIDSLAGASIRLGEIGDMVVIGEGIETVLSGCLHYECPGMAVINAGLMKEVRLPESVRNVVILADHDKSFTGQAAAFALARRLDNEGRRVGVVMTKTRGDFNDYPHWGACHRWGNHED